MRFVGLAAVFALLALAVACRCAERGFRPFKSLKKLVGGLTAFQKFAVAIAVSLLIAYGGTKTNDPPRSVPAPATVVLTDEQLAAGFALVDVSTNDLQSSVFNPQSSATVHPRWLLRGAFEDHFTLAHDGWRMQVGTNVADRIRIHAGGRAEACATGGTVVTVGQFWPFDAPLGIVPGANWHLIGNSQSSISNLQSLFWHDVTPSNTLMLTWQNALWNRDTNTPVSVQAELWPDGRFVYRYDLTSVKWKMENGEWDWTELTNVAVGAALGETPFRTPLADIASNSAFSILHSPFSIRFWPLDPSDTATGDRDGDGISTAEELFVHGTDPGLWDTDGDGVSDGDEVASGANPLVRDQGEGLTGGTTSPDFLSECGAAANRLVAWEIVPSAFSFARPTSLTNIVKRTFRVDRTSPWQQLYVSARANGAMGWDAADISIRCVADGGATTNEVPSVSADSWRVPLGPGPVTNLTFIVAATGGAPALSRPLHLLRWSPHVALDPDEAGRFLPVVEGKAPIFLSRRRAESGWYVVPFSASFAGVPHMGGVDAETAAQLALPPCAGLAVTNVPTRAFLSSDPVWAELPPEGTNAATRLCCWEMDHETPGAIDSGPRASRFDSPYPLSSPELRRAFHRAREIKADSSSSVTVSILPRHPLVGLHVSGAPTRLLRDASGSTNEPPDEVDVYPPGMVTPVFDGVPDGDDAYSVDADTPDEGPEESPPEDDEGGCGSPDPEKDDCDCAGDEDGTSQCSFRLRISLGSQTPGESEGFLWTSLEEPTAISPAVFNILGTDAVAATTNAVGEFIVTCSAPAGRTAQVANIEHGAAITVWNASGRLENRWEVTNPDGETSYVRCRKLTILGNAVSDETFVLCDGMLGAWGAPEESRVADAFPDDCFGRTDETRGVTTVKLKWRMDPDEPDFATDVRDMMFLADGTCVASAMSEYVKVGVGSSARRRLACRYGHDGKCAYEEEMDYWCDPENPYRHARLRSVWSSRRPWSFHDYDALGRETVEVEQLDGSPFPGGLAEVSHLAELPPGCSAKATVTSYEPQAGDSHDRNDAFLPRRRDTWVMRAGKSPVLVGTETWLYTRATGADGLPRRTCVHASGVGDALRGETAVSYPEDYDVPKELRGRTLSSTRFDGVASSCQIEKGTWDASAGTFAPDPDGAFLRMTTRRTGGGSEQDTYSVEIEDALRRLTVFSATGLTAGDALFSSARSTYDDIDRLRSTAYSDGTSETNAYSCCRLLWKRDRQKRMTLRSAQTGTDDLYNATEEIWLTNLTWGAVILTATGTTGILPVGDGSPGTTGVSPVDGFRVTQHFCDALGRETNTVTYAGTTPGEAAVPIGEAALLPLQHTGGTQLVASVTTAYPADAWQSPYRGPYSIRTDERGRETSTWESHYEYSAVTEEETQTNGVFISATTTTTRRNGSTATRRSWINPDGSYAWTEETRSTDWLPDGRRVVTVSTMASDQLDASRRYLVVTNSVTTYDLFGRVSTVAVPSGTTGILPVGSGGTGTTGVPPVAGWIVTSNAYDGVSDRILTSTRTVGDVVRTTYYLYNPWGEQVGTVLDGVTNRTDVTYEQFSNEWWKVETTVVIGPSTNSLTVTRTQLTGLSDACRRHTVTLTGTTDILSVGGGSTGTTCVSPVDCATIESLVTYDPATGIETETVTSTVAPTVIRRSLHGVLLSTETTGETTYNVYDAFARVAQTWRAAILAATGTTGILPVASYTYSPNGDLLATHTYTNGADYITETYAYDMLGNRIATTDAHGSTTYRTYDPLGNLTAEWGATYPVRYTYDSHGRRTSLSTTRDGTTWDTTTWAYDPYTGNCTSKTYADGSTITYTYTPDNLLLRTTYASGKWKKNVYDSQRRLCGVIYSSSDMDYELQLDDYGNATNVQDAAGNSWRYEYGFNSQLLSEEYAATGGTRSCASAATNGISRSYDSFDRPIGYTLTVNDEPKGGIGYAYDDDNRISHIIATNAAGHSFAVANTNNAGYNYGYTITTPNGDTIRRVVERDDYRRSLVTNCVTYFNSSLVDSNTYAFDALSRPTARTTGTTGVSSVDSTFSYNNRSEVVSAAIGTNLFTHAYDDIGNHLLFGDNAVTYTFTHNQVNQMVGRAAPSAPPTSFTYTPDGGLSSDGTWTYAYDAEDQLRSVTSRSLTNGAIRVLNTYDYRRRRTSKTVQRLNSTIPLPPSPPTGTQEWQTIETRTFVYDDRNLIHETIYTIDGGTTNTTEVQYFWGLDLSDSLQGAGGVGGLLAVSRNGEFYFPAYDNNGNVTKYIDESGNTVATYEYDDFGRMISQSGPLADFFRHRFSTKYFDAECGLYYYGYRYYKPLIMCWLTEDPAGLSGGLNTHLFCKNASMYMSDIDGRWEWFWMPDWTEEKARQEVRTKIQEMRENGYDFAADALGHYLRNTAQNIDLSRYSKEISGHYEWRKSFLSSVLKQLKTRDPRGTNKKVEIGDVAHKASFNADLQNGNILNMFTTQFSHRFYPTESMGLFYALYGSYYSYVGTASWCRRNKSTMFIDDERTDVEFDLQVASYDMLSYGGGFPRTTIPSYSAAQYLQKKHNYNTPFIYLRWKENGAWEISDWHTLYSNGIQYRKLK